MTLVNEIMFQVYSSMTHHMYIVLCIHYPVKSPYVTLYLTSLAFIYLLPSRSISSIAQFYFYIMMSCGTSKLLGILLSYCIHRVRKKSVWSVKQSSVGLWKLTVNFFLLQVTPFIHLFRTHCRTGNILSAGGRVMPKTRFPAFTEKTDKPTVI